MTKLVMFFLALVILASQLAVGLTTWEQGPSDSSLIYQDGRPNLLIGGIEQDYPDGENSNRIYKQIADLIDATYITTYFTGNRYTDALEVNNAASCAKSCVSTLQNGLSNSKLSGGDDTYNTIVAYSGGTTSAVTALDKQGVRCHTLILISPMIGMVPATTAGDYEQQIKRILESGAAARIVVIQSSDDQPDLGELYQAKFTKGKIAGVDVYDVDLSTNGNQAHEDIFFSYAKDHFKLGGNGRVYYTQEGTASTATPVRQLSTLGGKSTEAQLAGSQPNGKPMTQLSGSGFSDWLAPSRIMGGAGLLGAQSGLGTWGGYPIGMGPRKSEGFPAPRWGSRGTSGSSSGSSSRSSGFDPTAIIDPLFTNNDPAFSNALQAGMG